jgi:hypothetical protein
VEVESDRHTPKGPKKEKEKNGGAAMISKTFCQGYSYIYSVSESTCKGVMLVVPLLNSSISILVLRCLDLVFK